MNRNHSLIQPAISFTLALVLWQGVHSSFAQGTAFTYQGRLLDGGSAANGIYDLRFAVYDALSGGGLQGAPVTNSAATVSNGLFTVTLDFGPGVFTGPARWLEIGVRTNGNGPFLSFPSRQALSATPYAIFAAAASNVVNGSVVKSLNNLKDNITLSAGANVTITPSGNNLIVSSTGTSGTIWSLSGTNTYYSSGNVGIGTSTPQGLLDVNCGGSDLSALFVRGDPSVFGRGGILHHQSASFAWQELAQTTGSPTDGYLAFNYVNRTAPGTKLFSNVLALRGNGNVGVGTSVPWERLTVTSPLPTDTKIEVNAGGNQYSAIRIKNSAGSWNWQVTPSADAPGGRMRLTDETTGNEWFTVTHAGSVGIGSPNPAAKLDIASFSGDLLHLIGYEPFVTFYDSNNGYSRGAIQGVRGGLNLFTDSYLSAVNPSACVTLLNSGNLGVGTLNPQAKLDVIGTTRTCVLTITGGCDLAEPFDMDSEDMPKGSVVVIDDEKPGRLKLSREAYDTRVAGIVSGANGINAGISLQQTGAFETGQNVALSGRVYVQADATFGAIRPGDLLTTSGTPGHAMRVSDHPRAQGAIIGKAMGSLGNGRGLVLVLVSLQ